MPPTADAWRAGPFLVERGSPLPFGALETGDGINFSLFSRHARKAWLALFARRSREPLAEIELDPHLNRTGDVWHIRVRALERDVEYAWRLDGPHDPATGHRFDPNALLLDPYTPQVTGGEVWGEADVIASTDGDGPRTVRRSCLPSEDFDWEGDVPPRIPLEETVIYELHVRGYTVHPSSGAAAPGTYRGLTEKIPHLRKLGVTAVELMPVFEFNELEHRRHHPETGDLLLNFWGYSPLVFFAPKASYATGGEAADPVREFREMVKAFHRAGMEIILDVVFNHTAEGDERGPTVCFRGIDNSLYYMLDEHGAYRNFSGCGNTVNCNQPLVRDMILDCLRYWVAEMHVDGFRFDLASILGRGPDGEVLANPPLLERIAVDPVLAETKLIAEAWDAAGLNQVGSFPSWGRWMEWNGYFRDHVRLFWKGEDGMTSLMASRLCGSADLYGPSGRRPYHSINFVTAHDGFTLNDLVSYEEKHNEANGEDNEDGEEWNHALNFGAEGPTDDAEIRRLRSRQVKNFLVTLLVSQGVPMLLGGDEFRRTQKGNNNPYCQDNEISWVDWALAKEHKDLVRFLRHLVAFRKRHPALRRSHFFEDGSSDISWHGEQAHAPDWSPGAHWLAFLLDGTQPNAEEADDQIFVMMNASEEWRHFEVPHVGKTWHRVVDTAKPSPDDIAEEDTAGETVGEHHDRYGVEPHSTVVLVTG